MAASVTVAMFVFTYVSLTSYKGTHKLMMYLIQLPQAAFCSLFTGPLGFIAAIPLVLSESFVIVTFLAKFMYLGKIHDELCASY